MRSINARHCWLPPKMEALVRRALGLFAFRRRTTGADPTRNRRRERSMLIGSGTFQSHGWFHQCHELAFFTITAADTCREKFAD